MYYVIITVEDIGMAVKLVDMPGIVKLWITVRGFSLASAWIEHTVLYYRNVTVTKKTLKKSKPVRKQITSTP